MLTIGIVVCDRDAARLPAFMAQLNAHVTARHEVLVYDNTECETLSTVDGIDKVLCSPYGKRNIHQFQARRCIAEAARGDYVWYVDPNDEIITDVTDGLLFDAASDKHGLGKPDIVIFDVYRDGELLAAHFPASALGQGGECEKCVSVNLDDYAVVRFALWDRWLKTSALREAFAIVPGAPLISCYEDNLIQALMLRQYRTAFAVHKALYRYHANDSMAAGGGIHDGDSMSAYITGLNTVCGIFNMVFSTGEQMIMFAGNNVSDMVMSQAISKMAQAIFSHRDNAHEIITAALREVSVNDISAVLMGYRMHVPTEHLTQWAEVETDARAYMGVIDDNATTGTDAPMAANSNDNERIDAPCAINTAGRRVVSIMLDRQCNLHCPYCCQQNDRNYVPRVGEHGLTQTEVYWRFDEAMARLKAITPVYPQILGGEPTLWSTSLIERIAHRLKDYLQFAVLTNGTNRDSAWYSVHNAVFLTHVTDWESAKCTYPYASPRDTPMIVVTHQAMPLIEHYLDLNQCHNLVVSPAGDCGDPGMNATISDIKKLRELVTMHGLPAIRPVCYKMGHTVWQVDVMQGEGGGASATTCCHSKGGYVPIAQFTGQESAVCKGCTVM